MMGLEPAAKIRGGTFEGPGPNRYRSGASSGLSMHAGGGMVTEDDERTWVKSRGALRLSRAAAACWASRALRLKIDRCISSDVWLSD